MSTSAKITVVILSLALTAFVVGFCLRDSGVIEVIKQYIVEWRADDQDKVPDDNNGDIPDNQQPPDEDPDKPDDTEEPEPEPRPDPDLQPEPEPGPDPDPQPEPEPGPDPDPQPEPKPEPKPDPKPDPGDDNNNSDKDDGTSTPIIYPGQKLMIPGSQGTNLSPSQVITSGTVNSGTKQIALTFDSGWLYTQTIPLLDVLDQYGVKATFYPRALWVHNEKNPGSSYPDLAREIIERGHSMGNHSLTHPDMRELTEAQIRYEIQESTAIIKRITGVRPYMFRPPYGVYDSRVLKILGEEGYPYTVMWTIDTHDWAAEIRGQKVTEDYIVNRVLNNASNNGIVLMHIGGQYTVDALPRIINGLKDKGYSFNTVDKMLPPPGGEPVTYTVKPGDTLYRIAVNHGVTVEAIIKANNL